MAQIEGEIPPIGSKNVKMGGFSLLIRKNSPYLP